ncbi:MAG: pyroglutamyl-peptidase I [Clostridia bacterium]|nr:pyroglutamyl-peptidase I [Clostridia bacterium]
MAEKTLLITGFDPFGGEKINPSYEAVKLLPERVGKYNIVKLCVPTSFEKASGTVIAKAEECFAHVIVCVGQAGGRKGVTPEVIGINLRDARIPDNDGAMPRGVPVKEGGPAAYFSTLPVDDIVERVNKAGVPCFKSYSAGAFVCNDLLYSLLHCFDGTEKKIGFIHVPYLPQQAGDKHPVLTLEQITTALTAAIEVI